jgi:hypothetical protein
MKDKVSFIRPAHARGLASLPKTGALHGIASMRHLAHDSWLTMERLSRL